MVNALINPPCSATYNLLSGPNCKEVGLLSTAPFKLLGVKLYCALANMAPAKLTGGSFAFFLTLVL